MEEAMLLILFKVCKRQGCGAVIDGVNIEISRNGAAGGHDCHIQDHEFPGNKHFKECEHEASVP